MKVTLTAAMREALRKQLFDAFSAADFRALLDLLGEHSDDVAPNDAVRSKLILAGITTGEKKGTLLEILQGAVQQRPKQNELRDLYEQIREQARIGETEDLVPTLADILNAQKVAPRDIVRLFRAVAPRSNAFLLTEDAVDVAASATRFLAIHIDRRPLIAFAKLVHRELKESAPRAWLQELDRWIESTMRRLDITAVERQEVQELIDSAVQRLSEEHFRLTVTVGPVRPELPRNADSTYFLSAWHTRRCGEETERDRTSLEVQRVVSDRDLPREIAALVERVRPELDANSTLAVELFLPIRLLSLDADQWRIGNAEIENVMPVGTKYAVLLRSWERAMRWRPEQRGTWSRLWRMRKQRTSTGARAAAQDLADAGAFAARVDKENAASIALTFVPDDQALRAVVFGGVPIAVWCRCELPHHHKDIAALFESLLNRHHDDWDADVRNARLSAAAAPGANHYGEHLAVYWDDPERLPPGSKDDPIVRTKQ
ncbi:MAG TPA: hypothetical protein VHW00_06670 [Thermoanaerobaculia bacterium]|nr:hypothetical protein [Thermoanaerobaculia bacterium]